MRLRKPKFDIPERGVLHSYMCPDVDLERELHRAPEHIARNLERGKDRFGPRASVQSWEEQIYQTVADGTVVTASTESLLFPIFTLPANYLYQGRALPREQILLELGDVLWCLTIVATSAGLTLDQVARANIEKLSQRHPDGFRPQL